ncbi:MAG: SsrA-binding protein [Candidatus Pacebacteria bacterium CG10_big_fil_rev_8_21_14_0_10_56_10]|nr:MAG: SsrA-binding protein [Candidatus Pacebacteria bacterium CG10_big_fil_rev_8_21_14_0_10_56_10]
MFTTLLENRRARHDYRLLESFQAGLALTGAEVKSLRQRHGSLRGSYIDIRDDQAYLLGAQISPYQYADNREYQPKRPRKLLLKKQEIARLAAAQQARGQAVVPVSIALSNGKLKLNLAIARGLKRYQKRAQLKERAQQRDAAVELKSLKL